MNDEKTLCVYLDGNEYEVTVVLDIETGDDGVGATEFWGSVSYDSQPYAIWVLDEVLEVIHHTDHGEVYEIDLTKLPEGLEEAIIEEINKLPLPERDDD